jgi:hypothetical protein
MPIKKLPNSKSSSIKIFFSDLQSILLKEDAQQGIAQLALLVLLVAGVALGGYLVQNRTNFLPSAEETAVVPEGCVKYFLNQGVREVHWKKDANDPGTPWIKSLKEIEKPGAQYAKMWQYEFKEDRWTWPNGWKEYNTKRWAAGKDNTPDYDRTSFGPNRWETPWGTSHHTEDPKTIGIVEFGVDKPGTNFQGAESTGVDFEKSYIVLPSKQGVDCTKSQAPKGQQTCDNKTYCEGEHSVKKSCIDGKVTFDKSPEVTAECNNKPDGYILTTITDGQKGPAGGTITETTCDDFTFCDNSDPKKAVKKVPTKQADGTCSYSFVEKPELDSQCVGKEQAAVIDGSIGQANSEQKAVKDADIKNISDFQSKFKTEVLDNNNVTTEIRSDSNFKDAQALAAQFFQDAEAQAKNCSATDKTCLDTARIIFDKAKTAARLASYYAVAQEASEVCYKADFAIDDFIKLPTKTDPNRQERVFICNGQNGQEKYLRWEDEKGQKQEFVVTPESSANIVSRLETKVKEAETEVFQQPRTTSITSQPTSQSSISSNKSEVTAVFPLTSYYGCGPNSGNRGDAYCQSILQAPQYRDAKCGQGYCTAIANCNPSCAGNEICTFDNEKASCKPAPGGLAP